MHFEIENLPIIIMSKRLQQYRRHRMSVEKRYQVIRALEQGFSRNQVIEMFALKHSSNITTILQNREAIMCEMEKGTRPSAKSIRNQKFPMIDDALKRLIEKFARAGVPLTKKMLAEKAYHVARKYGVYSNYKASRGYLDTFLAHHGLDLKRNGKDAMYKISNTNEPKSPSLTQEPNNLKQQLLESLKIHSMHFVNQIGQSMVEQIEGCQISSGALDVLHASKCQLMDELMANLRSIFASLSDLLDLESTVFVEIANDLMQHHLALTSILISQFRHTLRGTAP